MSFGDFIDSVIEPFAPAAAARRRAARIGLAAIRQYDAAKHDRRTYGWRRPATSANAEIGGGLVGLRNGARELVRNNKYAAAARRQMVAQIVGDGITARAVHDDAAVARAAQDEWDEWSASKVYQGTFDYYHVQKLIVGGTIEGGEMLQVWHAAENRPDASVDVLEGDLLDNTKTQRLSDGRIVQGVEFDRDGNRRGYWLFDEHPGDVLFRSSLASNFVSARNVDHIFEQTRSPQARGVSWFAPVMLTLRDVSEIEDARRLKEKVEACLALVLTTSNENVGSPVLTGERQTQTDGRPDIETLRPGMVFRARPGEEATTVNPTASADTVNFLRQQLAAVSASLIPYHLMTGDVTGANYTALRAALLSFWSLLDDWQQQIFIPLACQSAFDRRMRVLATETGDARYLKVKAQWAVPMRPLLDPVKDMNGEIIAIRAGLKTLTKALTERGIDVDKHLTEIARINGLIDDLKLALDSDPRRLTDAGILQAAAGYLATKGGAVSNAASDTSN